MKVDPLQSARSAGAPVVGRLAPSPSGELHVGHARSFLFAWWSARSRGGRVVLRIEDLDPARSRQVFVDGALRDLEWLGLDWDAAPLLQSADLGPIERALETLVLRGLAYPCTCSRKDVRFVTNAPHASDAAPGELVYPGLCRGRFRSLRHAERSQGQAAGLRLRVPPGPITIHDDWRGPFTEDVAATVGDFLLAGRGGSFAYQLAVVVDDARQGVTEVLRADDLLSSTPRQWFLQELLGLPHPRWIHVPLVVGDDGQRLAKRTKDLSLRALREAGIDPRTLVAWAARSAGLRCDERVHARELVPRFDLERLPRGTVTFGARERAALAP